MRWVPHDESPLRRSIVRPVRTGREGGFSFPEILVAAALGALVLVVAAIAFQAVGAFTSRQSSGYGTITFANTSTLNGFYGTASTTIATWSAPSSGYLARAEMLREKFIEDTQKAVAVYCLPRVGQSTVRPTSLPLNVGSYTVGSFDFRRLGTSEDFRDFLEVSLPAAVGTFETNAFSVNGASSGRNLSIMILRKSAARTELTVQAVYEIDFVRPASPGGVYASVRRYQGTVCTDYYDVFYPDLPDTTVSSSSFFVAASFERAGRPASTYFADDVAGGQPFYFVWWPDAAATTLPEAHSSYINAMGDQTSFFMVVPMFPAL